MSCCITGLTLKEEYDNALRFEALTYARLIAHKRRHEGLKDNPNSMRHMRMVNEIARKYTQGDYKTHGKISSNNLM